MGLIKHYIDCLISDYGERFIAVKKRVLFYISQFHKGGAEKSLLELIKSIDKTIISIDLIISNQVPVEGTVSLINELPNNIRICNVYEKKKRRLPVSKSIFQHIMEGERFDETAVRFVEKNEYDLAVHVGEWHSPEFVALVVNAKRKVCWIHADIDKINGFNADSFFSVDERIDKYYFVSKNSRNSAEYKYPFIKGKTGLLHNKINTQEIQKLSMEKSGITKEPGALLLVSVGNIRKEKGYLRALDVIKELKKNDIPVKWWIIGHQSEIETVYEMKKQISQSGLRDSVLFLGAQKNPYSYMKLADAIINLSDNESWSLVISEAKILGIPIVATKTSGAIEQLENRVNGIVTSFEPDKIAAELIYFYTHPELNKIIRNNLKNDTIALPNATAEFNEILFECDKKQKINNDILYVIDDINYPGGAHYATFKHINHLVRSGREVAIYSTTLPTYKTRTLLSKVSFYSFITTGLAVQFSRRLIPGLLTCKLTFPDKKLRIKKFFDFRANHKDTMSIELEKKYVSELASQFVYTCVMSEGSAFKEAVAESKARKKIQWIHTDYYNWSILNKETNDKVRKDNLTWESFDKIVFLSEMFIYSFKSLFPQFSEKCDCCGNIIDAESVREKAREPIKRKLKIVVCCDGYDHAEIEDALVSLEELDKRKYAVDCIFFFNNRNDFRITVPKALSGKVIALYRKVSTVKLLEGKDILIIHDKSMSIPTEIKGSVETIAVSNDLGQHITSFVTKGFTKNNDQAISFISSFRFEAIKQPLLIIEALRRVKDCGYNFYWTFIGDGDLKTKAEELSRNLKMDDCISFLGHLDNPFPYIASADYFVQFSIYEGLPNTIWEALSLGVPVITSDVGAVRDQVKNDINGFIIGPSIGDLIDIIIFAADPQNRDKVNSLKTAALAMDWSERDKITKRKLLEIFSI